MIRRLTEIKGQSGDHVQAGQELMSIDPLHQQASVGSAEATERQKKALYDYNTSEVARQRKLFEAGIISRDVYEQAEQSYENSKADYESASASTKTALEHSCSKPPKPTAIQCLYQALTVSSSCPSGERR